MDGSVDEKCRIRVKKVEDQVQEPMCSSVQYRVGDWKIQKIYRY